MHSFIVANLGNRTTITRTRDMRLESAHFTLQSASSRINQTFLKAPTHAGQICLAVAVSGHLCHCPGTLYCSQHRDLWHLPTWVALIPKRRVVPPTLTTHPTWEIPATLARAKMIPVNDAYVMSTAGRPGRSIATRHALTCNPESVVVNWMEYLDAACERRAVAAGTRST